MEHPLVFARNLPRYLALRARRLGKRSTRGLARIGRRCVTTARLSALGADTPARLKILAALPSLASAGLVGRPLELELSLQVKNRDLRIVAGDPSELEALYEVLVDDEYDLPAKLAPNTVVDLGSHIGASVIALKLAYPNSQVIAVEPDARSFARLSRNVAPFPGVTCLNLAVGHQAGRQSLYRQSGESWASSLVPNGKVDDGPKVEVRTLDEILARAGVTQVDLVKFDIESSEWDIFPALSRLPVVQLLVGEIHFTRPGQMDFNAVQQALPGFAIKILRSDKYGGLIHAWRC